MPNTTDPALVDDVIAFQHEWAATIGREFSNGNWEIRDFSFRFRATNGMRRTDGRWRIVHEHLSFPVDLETGQADLQSRR